MKALLTLLVFISIQEAFASNIIPLGHGDFSLSQAQGEIVSIKKMCPRIPGQMSCMAFGSIVTIKIQLNGCVDRLGGYFTEAVEVNRTGFITLGAINIASKASRVTRCTQMPFETVSITVPFEGKIELVNLKYNGMKIRN